MITYDKNGLACSSVPVLPLLPLLLENLCKVPIKCSCSRVFSDVCVRRSQSFVRLLENLHRVVRRFCANRKKAEEEETLRKEAEAEAAAQIAELDRQLKVIL